MKQCPVCKTTYTDQTLRFCLADGANLSVIFEAEDPTLVSPNRNLPSADIPQTAILTAKDEPKKRSWIPLVVFGVIGLFLLMFAGVAVVALVAYYGSRENTPVANSASNANVLTVSDNSKSTTAANSFPVNNRIKEQLADLQKQIEEQKKQKANSAVSLYPNQTPENYKSPTARVAQTNDGFLSLRTEPSVKTGTQILKIPSGETVRLENCEKNLMTIDNRRGRWCMVSYADEIGWVFDAWLLY